MAATRTVLKQYFKKYATPTEEQFAALIDAFVHKDEDSLTQSKIDGLTAALESKVSSSDLASAVATAVGEILQGSNIEVTPAAHQHAIADVEGLQAFVTKVNNFLESADVSDETINRWVEIETFLTGITDQETLTGLLLNLKNEILAQIPEPQTGNYLEQVTDMAAVLQTAEVGKIVQYVGQSDAEYTRGLCYENKGNAGWNHNTKLPTYSIENCPVKEFINSTGTHRSVFPSANEILANNIIVPKIFRIRCSGDVAYGAYLDINSVLPSQVEYCSQIGTHLIGELYDPTTGFISQKFQISNNKVYYYAPTDILNVTNDVEFLDDALNNIFITETSVNRLYLYNIMPDSSYILCQQAYKGKYGSPSVQTGTITDLETTEEFNGEILVREYNIGGWQPIVTSPVVS